jgi:APA family basic amino acid/polyamine antiporter
MNKVGSRQPPLYIQGPALIISFVISGIAAALAALVYAELAAAIPASGSSYTYAYVALGEVIAWF